MKKKTIIALITARARIKLRITKVDNMSSCIKTKQATKYLYYKGRKYKGETIEEEVTVSLLPQIIHINNNNNRHYLNNNNSSNHFIVLVIYTSLKE